MTSKVVLFDRDGTLILDPADCRVDSIDKIELFPDTVTALTRLAQNDFQIIMITNQAGIAEGRITVEEFENINGEVTKRLEQSGIKVLKTFVCPHGVENTCECRKPKPKMLLDAINEFNLDPEAIFMVGDRVTDMEAAKNAGCKSVLVKTANEPQVTDFADHIAENLTEVVDILLSSIDSK